MRWIILFLLLLVRVSPAQSLRERIESVLESSPAAKRAFWGIQVVELGSGTTLFQSNPNRFFVPASNAKLFTTALALVRLGPDHRFETEIRAGVAPDAAGRIAGDLGLIGGGDPTLSARAVPYQKGPASGDPLQAIEALADQVQAAGVRRIDGDVAGDDSAWVWAPYPEGWAHDDTVWDYGAPVSALAVGDNVVALSLRASGTGGRAPSLFLSPALEYYSIDNRVRSGPGLENKVSIERLPGSRQLRLWGTMSSDPASTVPLLVAIDDPALYAAFALVDALGRRGIQIAGRPVARHWFANQGGSPPAPGGVVLARRSSAPLVEILRIIAKASQNLYAEMVLREVARVRKGTGSREAGLEEARAFLAEAGLEEADCHFADGSGLSTSDLVTPAAVMKLLRHMHRSQYRDTWISLLPLGGEDGTLSTRFEGKPEARRIHAKTGTLTHAAALSGYAESRSRGLVAFSILVNNFNAPGAEIRAVIDKIALLLTE
ncbi:MAG: D-alanyl-D-alanine carboxypeptidase/D-alanyl-D-alanine-endopeptidase [Bryobacteraceae bacterium]|jgi:D-alanyl-D-alanine carboxypeptidase/D-alanyl-D-alanine-endopeptidase (penicillin-binding protein 4)